MKLIKFINNSALILCASSMISTAMDSADSVIWSDSNIEHNIPHFEIQDFIASPFISVPYSVQNTDQDSVDHINLDGDCLIANPKPVFLAFNLDDKSNAKIKRILNLGENSLNETSKIIDDYTIKAIFKKDNENNNFCLEEYKRQGQSQNFHITLHANEFNCAPHILNELQNNIKSGNITFRIKKIEVQG